MAKNVLRGRNLILKYKGSAIPVSTSCKISLGTSTVDSTTKDDAEDWEENDIITENWSVTADKLVTLTGKSSETRFTSGGYYAKNRPEATGTNELDTATSSSSSKPVSVKQGQTITISPKHADCFAYKVIGEYAPGARLQALGKITEWTAPEDSMICVFHAATQESVSDDSYHLNGIDPLVNVLSNLPVEADAQFDIEEVTYSGKVLITQNDLDGSVKQNGTQSLTMQGNGELTKTTKQS